MMSDESPRRTTNISRFDEERFMRRVDWNLFRQFYEIALSGSLSAAARRLNLNQPSLSAALKRLEEHVGLTLCRRSSHGIELTPPGKALMALTSEMVEIVRLTPHLTSQAAHRVEGALFIRMISNVISSEIDESIASFHRRYPNVSIRLEVSAWRSVLESVASNECDIGVACDSAPRRHLQYEAIGREYQQLYCGRSHPFYGHRIRDPASLSSQRFILTNADEPEDLERFRKRYGLGAQLAGQAEDIHEARRLIELGVGVGFLPTLHVDEPASGPLWPILSAALLPSYLIYLVAPPTAQLSTPAQLFLQEVRRRMRAKPDIDRQD